jgi:hypothetical protein
MHHVRIGAYLKLKQINHIYRSERDNDFDERKKCQEKTEVETYAAAVDQQGRLVATRGRREEQRNG